MNPYLFPIPISMILAVDNGNNIGKNNRLPWGHFPEDMRWFQEKTINSTMLMGSNTWKSLPGKLKNRHHIVLSSKLLDKLPDTTLLNRSFEDSIRRACALSPYPKLFIIGGKRLFEEGIQFVSRVYLTRINHLYDGDVKVNLDEILSREFYINNIDTILSKNNNIEMKFYEYVRIKKVENPGSH